MVRPIHVTTEDEREFQVAMDQYKRRSGRQFPTWSEILEVLRSIGYAKRIWKPVDPWSPLLVARLGETHHSIDQTDSIGWYATVETANMP